jgi:hypothetical protein
MPRKVYKMTISTQQINTVLRTYNKQLKLAGLNRSNQKTPPQSRKDEVTISLEGKKQQIYRQTANHIVEKLTKK